MKSPKAGKPRFLVQQEAEERAAISRREEGETMRSAFGGFQLGEAVVFRRGATFGTRASRIGVVVSRCSNRPSVGGSWWIVRLPDGEEVSVAGEALKLLADAMPGEVPPPAVDLGADDEDFRLRFRRAREL